MPTFRSFAKLNLHLEVLGRRPDGFHELRTLFQTIDLADEIEIEPTRSGDVELTVEGAAVPSGDENLAHRAAAAYLRDWGATGEGVRMRLRKRIPAGGGLGGGSANAATVLEALPELFGRAPDPGWSLTAARRLGADVPYFLVGGLALGRGRGDEILPLADPPPQADEELWLALPPIALSTAEVFSALAAAPTGRAPGGGELAPWSAGSPVPPLERLIGSNDLEEPAFLLRPELGAIYTALVRSGALRVRMSGSGSTLFALFSGPAGARRAAAALPPGIAWRRARTLGRAAWRLASGFGPVGAGGG